MLTKCSKQVIMVLWLSVVRLAMLFNLLNLFKKNMQLYEIRNGYELMPRNLAEALCSKTPYNFNLQLAGYDPKDGPQLYCMFYLASMINVTYAVHGHGVFIASTIYLLSVNRAFKLQENCVLKLKKRFDVNNDRFSVRVVNKEVIHHLPDLV
ncbi:unnamed protein product [Mesocestoides corti]|uniref:Uncharacterized protein n=1 Tax=Mesocestoides corti TaxID=53468 RepID=A0A0R3UR67_MESCO|nr:unnamed protein product [Mesocestoides corti]